MILLGRISYYATREESKRFSPSVKFVARAKQRQKNKIEKKENLEKN